MDISRTRLITPICLISVLFAIQLAKPQLVSGQDSQKSLGEVAREAKNGKARAKIFIDDENLNASKAVIPDITLPPQLENADEITRAIEAYKKSHTAEDTEKVIREWYDRQDSVLARKVDEVLTTYDRQKEGTSMIVRDRPSSDDRRYQEQLQTLEMDAKGTRISLERSQYAAGRLQGCLERVRSNLSRLNIKYDWFKIRYTNGMH